MPQPLQFCESDSVSVQAFEQQVMVGHRSHGELAAMQTWFWQIWPEAQADVALQPAAHV
jgi:hypothetical protein